MQLFIFLSVSVVSFIAILAMLSYKAWEIKVGKVSTLSHNSYQNVALSSVIEHLLKLEHIFVDKSLYLYREVKKYNVSDAVDLMQNHFPGKYVKQKIDQLNGKNGELKKGGASSFLKKMSEHKEVYRENINEAAIIEKENIPESVSVSFEIVKEKDGGRE